MTKIGDIIRAGDPIPPDVVRMTDADALADEYWERTRTDPLEYAYHGGAPRTAVDIERHGEWFPMTVTDVGGGPRIWSKLDAAEDMPDVVDVENYGRWRRCTGVSWRYEPFSGNPRAPIGDRATLEELRFLGDVTEVLP